MGGKLRIIGRLAVAFGLISVLLLSGAPAHAKATAAPEDGFNTANWFCNDGDVCVWTGYAGNLKGCAWADADPDWYGGNIQCSWADNQPFLSALNAGTSTAYGSVRIHSGANYTGSFICIERGDSYQGSFQGRSHRWVTSAC